jgi:hypothetical protein
MDFNFFFGSEIGKIVEISQKKEEVISQFVG